NETNRRILLHQTSRWGMRAQAVGSAREGLAALRAEAAGRPFDVAIIDKLMPQMDGMEVAETVSGDPVLATTRLVMLTSAGIPGEVERARRAGFAGYLTKPVRESQLHACLAAVMGRPPGTPRSLVTRHSLREDGARARAHLLVAEDNSVNQKLTVKMLEKLGYRADVAGNGLEALEALGRIPYAAVLMDCQMPDMDGYEASRVIRRRERSGGGERRTPIIAMTASAFLENQERCREAGMDDFVAKPVDIDHLADVLGRWVDSGRPTALRTPGGRDAGGPHPGSQSPAPPPVPPPTGPPAVPAIPLDAPLDADRLGTLRSMAGGEQVLQQVIHLYLEELPGRLDALVGALQRREAPALEFAAHRLKGASGTLGATRLARLCEGLEEQGRSGSCDAAEALLADVASEARRVRAALLEAVAPAEAGS
ncbi:MAG: response regulator, partial [Actinomycetota bacterium]